MYTDSFSAFVHRVRAGDEAAAAQLVMQYQPVIQRVIHNRLLNSGLGQVLDTLDISQSVLGNFFARITRGEFELHSPADLRKLLVTMARNALRDHQRHFQRERYRIDQGNGNCLAELAAKDTAAPQPSEVLVQRELSERIREAMSYEEWCLAVARVEGRSWQEIAAECGETPNAVRMRLSRVMARIRRTFTARS